MGGVGDGGKGLAVGIAAFAQGPAVARDMEEQAAEGIGPVHAAILQEAQAAFRPGEPRGPALHRVVEREQHPAHAALRPHGLVGVQQRAIAVETMQEAPVLGVHAAGEPEGDAVGFKEEGQDIKDWALA